MGKQSQKRRQKKEEMIKARKDGLQYHESLSNPFYKFWRKVPFLVYTVCFLALAAYPFLTPYLPTTKSDVAKTAILHTSNGDIEVQLYAKEAPNTVSNFAKLSRNGFYNNLTWHRVIKGFMIQGGDPQGTGTGGPGYKFDDEINPYSLGLTQDVIDQNIKAGYTYNYSLNSHKAKVGSIAMANSGPNTNGSQFFIITEQDQPSLDGKYTVFGQVTKGLETAVAISEVKTGENDKPEVPVMIDSIEIR